MPAPLNQFSLVTAYIRLDTPVNGYSEYDITPYVAEFDIFENIDVPFLTGNIVFTDISALSSTIFFEGREHVYLEWSVGDQFYQKEFVVSEVTNDVKVVDGGSLISLALMEPHGALSYMTRLRSYREGTIDEIIHGLVTNHLNVEMDYEKMSKPSTTTLTVLDSDRTPLAIANHLTKNAVNDLNEPFYLYSTINEGILFKNLTDMESIGVPGTFTYSATQSASASRDVTDYSIISYVENVGASMIKRGKQHALSTKHIVVDPNTGQFTSNSYSYTDHVASKGKEGRYSDVDSNFRILDEDVLAEPMATLVEISPTELFPYTDSVSEEKVIERHQRKVSRQIDDRMIRQKTKTIVVYGTRFADDPEETKTVGRTIDIVIPKNWHSIQENGNMIDNQKSGNHLVMAARHIFKPLNNQYTISMMITKLDSSVDISDPNREETLPS